MPWADLPLRLFFCGLLLMLLAVFRVCILRLVLDFSQTHFSTVKGKASEHLNLITISSAQQVIKVISAQPQQLD
jgi:hypothetical protein